VSGSPLSAADRGAIPRLSQEELSKALNTASQNEEYDWMRTRYQPPNGADDAFLKRLAQDLRSVGRTVKSWFSGLLDFLRNLFKKLNPASDPEASPDPLKKGVQWLLYVAGALVLLAAVAVLLRSIGKREQPPILASNQTNTHDLTQENVLASDLPEEEWLGLARDFLAKGELRLAVRAMYLSNLAYLGAQQFIRIAGSKSNSIYEREVRQRPRGAETFRPFSHSNRSFERVWYGFHEVTPEFVALFQQDVEAIRSYAKT
jgi:hypothetical protein